MPPRNPTEHAPEERATPLQAGPKRTTSAPLPRGKRRTARLGLVKLGREQRRRMIATAAYYKAEERDFKPGYELEDWLEAEKEVDALLR